MLVTDLSDYFRSSALPRDVALLLTKKRSVADGLRVGTCGRWRFIESTGVDGVRAYFRWDGRRFIVLDSGAAITAVRLRTGALCDASTNLGERYLREIYRCLVAVGMVGDARYWTSATSDLAKTIANCLRSIYRVSLLDLLHEEL